MLRWFRNLRNGPECLVNSLPERRESFGWSLENVMRILLPRDARPGVT